MKSELFSCAANEAEFKRALPHVAFVTLIFLLLFMGRIIIGPLMVEIQRELGISHTQSGGLFFVIALGAGFSVLLSGFVAAAVNHKRTICLAALIMGACLWGAGHAPDLFWFRLALFGAGMGVGLYLPSAIAYITCVAPAPHWGKALSVHECAPNTAFTLTPLLAELVLHVGVWRDGPSCLGLGLIVVGTLFFLFAKGGDFKGTPPRLDVAVSILSRPVFWMFTWLVCLAVGVTLGSYGMLPLFLVHEHGMTREAANQLVAISRISGIFMGLVGGWLTDKLGPVRTIGIYLAAAGSVTIALGLASGSALVAMVMLQPLLSVIYFPAGYTLLSRMFDARTRSLAVSLSTPVSAALGAGAIPTLLGMAGDHIGFGNGFVLLGGALLLTLFMMPVLGREHDAVHDIGVTRGEL